MVVSAMQDEFLGTGLLQHYILYIIRNFFKFTFHMQFFFLMGLPSSPLIMDHNFAANI